MSVLVLLLEKSSSGGQPRVFAAACVRARRGAALRSRSSTRAKASPARSDKPTPGVAPPESVVSHHVIFVLLNDRLVDRDGHLRVGLVLRECHKRRKVARQFRSPRIDPRLSCRGALLDCGQVVSQPLAGRLALLIGEQVCVRLG